MCRDVSIERYKSELAASGQQLAAQRQQLDALESTFTQQTAQLHKAQASVGQLQTQVCLSLQTSWQSEHEFALPFLHHSINASCHKCRSIQLDWYEHSLHILVMFVQHAKRIRVGV